jgi:hypothetical protein
VADEREKERLKALQASNGSKQETAAWPTAAVRQRTATLRAEHNAAQASATPSATGNDEPEDGDDDDDEDGENDACEAAGSGGGGEDDGRMGGSQRTRRRASKLNRRQVLQAIARYDVSQKED